MPPRTMTMTLVGLFALVAMAGVGGSLTSADSADARALRDEPALVLPDPAPGEIAVPDWPDSAPLANSVRAWHYLPSMVKPLLELGRAVDDVVLSRATSLLLAGVVASRNQCLY